MNCKALAAIGVIIALVSTVEALAKDCTASIRLSVGDQEYWVEQVAEGLKFPSSMAWLPNGDLLITERTGGLRVIRNDKLDPKLISGTPASFQGFIFDGLKDILLDPDYETNEIVYFLISEGSFQKRHAAVYRARYGASGLRDVERIFRTKDEIGGPGSIATRMMFLSDKTLLIAVPEDHKQRAQQLNSHLGKILRIDRNGSIPKDNPYLGTPGALPEIFSYGHRVPLALFQERTTGVIFELESGEVGGDELNVIKAGGNFGWAKASWGFDYAGGVSAPLQSGAGIEDPILLWTPSVTPSGLTRYQGGRYPLWEGDYFLGHLTNRALERIRIDDGRVVLQERLLIDLKERVRDVKVGPDHLLYLLTDHQNGRVLRLQPGHASHHQRSRIARKLDPPVPSAPERASLEVGDPMKGKVTFLERCAACHRIGGVVEGGRIGPDLTGVYKSRIGRRRGFAYSPNMADSPHMWTSEALDEFLADPSGFMPGTKMAIQPVVEPDVRWNIITFLKQQSSEPD